MRWFWLWLMNFAAKKLHIEQPYCNTDINGVFLKVWDDNDPALYTWSDGEPVYLWDDGEPI